MTDKPRWLRPHGTHWTRGEGRTVWENPWLALRVYDAVAPTGKPAHYAVVGFKNLAIAVLPLHEDGTVTLVGQHRFPLADYSWEIPEGGGPAGETPLEAAKRELAEEAGLAATDWLQVLHGVQLSNSITDERGYGFIATGLSPVPTDPDETEALAIARVPFREALEQALAGNLPDLLTVAMLLRAYHMAREGELAEPLAKAMLSSAR